MNIPTREKGGLTEFKDSLHNIIDKKNPRWKRVNRKNKEVLSSLFSENRKIQLEQTFIETQQEKNKDVPHNTVPGPNNISTSIAMSKHNYLQCIYAEMISKFLIEEREKLQQTTQDNIQAIL